MMVFVYLYSLIYKIGDRHVHADGSSHYHLEDFGYRGAVAIKVVDSSIFTIKPIAKTHPNSTWLKAKPLVLDSAKAVYTLAEGDSAADFTLGMMLKRKVGQKEQRILVSNGMLNENKKGAIQEVYSWLHYNEYPIYASPKYPIDQIRITKAGAATTKIIYVWVVPGLLLGFANTLLIRRKRK